VIVLKDTPRPGFDVPACLSRHPKSPAKCAFPKAGHIDLDAPLTAGDQAASPRVSVLDVNGLLCPSSTCPVVTKQGVVLYRDHHHLTASFSASLGPSLAPRLAAALP
jgi:hypothetical protein